MSIAPSTSPSFASLVQEFFQQRLLAQRNASPHTIASYRDAFRVLFEFTERSLRRAPASLTLADLDATLVLRFLDHLESDRHNGIRTRNARLAALHSFYRYAASRDPASLPVIQRVLAIPLKRYNQPMLGFLTREEIHAILRAVDLATWSGKRDHALFTTLYNTGARVSEATSLRVQDFVHGPGAYIRVRGKGRKERSVPLWRSTARLLSAWLKSTTASPQSPLFPNRHGEQLTRSGVADRLRRTVTAARAFCPALRGRSISPHTLRHTTAMHLLQSGVDITVIALWLGHESPETTHRYVESDLQMKQTALARIKSPASRRAVRQTPDALLAFLKQL
jgi:site-specific recombinase XerD